MEGDLHDKINVDESMWTIEIENKIRFLKLYMEKLEDMS